MCITSDRYKVGETNISAENILCTLRIEAAALLHDGGIKSRYAVPRSILAHTPVDLEPSGGE